MKRLLLIALLMVAATAAISLRVDIYEGAVRVWPRGSAWCVFGYWPCEKRDEFELMWFKRGEGPVRSDLFNTHDGWYVVQWDED